MRFFTFLLMFCMSCDSMAQTMPEPVPSYPAIPGSEGENLVSYVNLQRMQLGLNPLRFSDQLTCASSIQATYINLRNACIHEGPLGQSFTLRARLCGGVASGEVIACGYSEFTAVVLAWLKDKSHRDVLLDPAAYAIGGARIGGNWVMVISK